MTRYDTYCGLYCGACLIPVAMKLGTTAELAARFNTPEDTIFCEGCKSDVVFKYCQACKMRQCAIERGIEFCHLCDDYPCDLLKNFSSERPHRNLIFKQNDRLKEIGLEAWLAEQKDRWLCRDCGTGFAWYEEKCRTCGADLYNSVREAEDLKV